MKLPVLEEIQTILEKRAEGAFVEASNAAGRDNYSDVFAQGKFQAYRDAAKLLSEFKREK